MNPREVKLASEQRERLLRNIWLLHDGRWFLKSVEELGFEAATRLNLAVVRSLGKTEIKQLLTETGCGEIRDIQDLKALVEIAAFLYFPQEHKYQVEVADDETLVGRVLECYLYKMVSAAGATGLHQCAGKTRFESWLRAANLSGEVLNEKNTNNCNGSCEFVFKIRWERPAAATSGAPASGS